jgi:hypothetical protein
MSYEGIVMAWSAAEDVSKQRGLNGNYLDILSLSEKGHNIRTEISTYDDLLSTGLAVTRLNHGRCDHEKESTVIRSC